MMKEQINKLKSVHIRLVSNSSGGRTETEVVVYFCLFALKVGISMTVFMFGKLNSNPGYLVWENNTDFCPYNKITHSFRKYRQKKK